MNVDKRLKQIMNKQVFETGGNTIKAKDVEWLIQTIIRQDEEIRRLKNER